MRFNVDSLTRRIEVYNGTEYVCAYWVDSENTARNAFGSSVMFASSFGEAVGLIIEMEVSR